MYILLIDCMIIIMNNECFCSVVKLKSITVVSFEFKPPAGGRSFPAKNKTM